MRKKNVLDNNREKMTSDGKSSDNNDSSSHAALLSLRCICHHCMQINREGRTGLMHSFVCVCVCVHVHTCRYTAGEQSTSFS